jgi:hypothetical protein
VSSFNYASPEIKACPVSPNFRVAAHWLKRAASKNLIYFFGQPIAIFSHDPLTLHPREAYLQQGLLSGGPEGVEFAE